MEKRAETVEQTVVTLNANEVKTLTSNIKILKGTTKGREWAGVVIDGGYDAVEKKSSSMAFGDDLVALLEELGAEVVEI